MTQILRVVFPLFFVLLSGCAVMPQENPGAGATLSYSCHIAGDYDLYMMGSSHSKKPPPNWKFGVGALGCYSIKGVNFDDGATLSVAGDHRKLPEYLYFWWSRTPQGSGVTMTDDQKKEYLHIVTNPPTYWGRVAIRSQVPQTIVDEVRKSPPSKLGDGQNELRLHIYLEWSKHGIRLTWAEYKDLKMIKYGGYVPPGPMAEIDKRWFAQNPQVVHIHSKVIPPEPYRSWPPSQ